MKRDENPPVATMSWPDPTFISRVIDALRELGNYKGGRLSSVCHGMFPILSHMNLSGHTGCSIWSETMVGLAMILPISALTEGNLAELAVQLGHMGELQKQSQLNHVLRPDGTPCNFPDIRLPSSPHAERSD